MSLKGGQTNGSSEARAAGVVCQSGSMNAKKIITMGPKKRVALLAHDEKKQDLFDWAKFNRELLAEHDLYATRTTGKILEELGLRLVKLESGPLGGDQQIGAKICEGEIDFVVFFSDPLEPLPHDPDIRALLRIAIVWNIPLPAICVGTPVQGGPTYRESHLAMEKIADSGKMLSFELAEVNPVLDVANRTAELGVKLISSAFGKKIM
jgi:methylglyoxal synthase